MIRRSFVGACVVACCLLPTVVCRADLLDEGFDDISTLPGAGWVLTNNSTPPTLTDWFQGNNGIFDAQQGAPDSYIAANFLNADFGGNVSNWLILPALALDPTVVLTFFTRTEPDPFPGDHLEVRLSTAGTSADVGATDSSVGDFTTLLLEINPTGDAYPTDWTEFSVPLNSVLGGPVVGRLAFRYVVTDTVDNGDYIGIDTVRVAQVPEPASIVLGLIAAVCLCATTLRARMGR